MRQYLQEWSIKLDKAIREKTGNTKKGKRDRVKITIAENDSIWLEIYIPEHLRMPFDEDWIARHLKHLTHLQENNPDEDGKAYQAHLY